MRGKRLFYCVVVYLATSGAGYYGFAAPPSDVATTERANPEDTSVSDRSFRSAYFGMTLPLPDGWKLGDEGPPPSQSGEYVLGTFVSEGEHVGTIVVTAQDMFFAAAPYHDASTMVEDFRRATAEVSDMTIDREPSQKRIGGKVLYRVDFNGVGLFRSMLATDLRCHIIRITATAPGLESLATLVRGLENLSFDTEADANSAVPACIKGYATAETTLRQVEPARVGDRYAPIPVRVIIGTDGDVKWVHVIRATADQRRSIEAAVRQWKLRPLVTNGRAQEVETDLLIRFTPHGN
jgi:hypothetical protein